MPEPTESAVLVTVPAADDAVGDLRQRLDEAARWGVPAHVTVLYPFVPPAQLDDAVLEGLAAAVLTVPRFVGTWSRTAWFDEEVLWLAPEPADRFRALTAAVMHAFPQFPPYGGRHPDVTPHLTVGHHAPPAEMHAAEREIAPALPFSMPVTHVQVMAGTTEPGSWRSLAQFPLGP